MRIGILMTGHALPEVQQTLGDYDAMFARLLDGHGFTFARYDVVDEIYPQSPGECDGWLITGSRHGAYEDHPWIAPLEAFIRDIDAARIPLVGICFGHQIIAQALGGRVEKFSGGWAIGATAYRIEDRTMVLNAWHQDQVTELPPGARVTGSNDFCALAALRYGTNIMSYQAHPEFGPDMVRHLMRLRAPGLVPETLIRQAARDLDTPLDDTLAADRIAAFFLKGA